jgi:hypothetical protein
MTERRIRINVIYTLHSKLQPFNMRIPNLTDVSAFIGINNFTPHESLNLK